MPEATPAQAELQPIRVNPLDVAASVVKHARDRLPSHRQVALGVAAGLGLMTAACFPSRPESPPIPPNPIVSPRVPGTEVASSVPEPRNLTIEPARGATAEAQPLVTMIEQRPFPSLRADGTPEFSQPLRLEERKALEQDVDTVTLTIRELVDDDYLKQSGVDLDQIAKKLKDMDDEQLVTWLQKRSYDRSGDYWQDQVYLFIPDTTFSVMFVHDRKTGQIVAQGVSFSVDQEGNYIGDYEEVNRRPQTLSDFLKLPLKLSRAIVPPQGSKPGFSPDKLFWEMPLVRPGENPKEGLSTQMYIRTMKDWPYPTSDDKYYEVSIGGSENGYNLVNIDLHQPDRGWAGKGKGPDYP